MFIVLSNKSNYISDVDRLIMQLITKGGITTQMSHRADSLNINTDHLRCNYLCSYYLICFLKKIHPFLQL